MAKRSNRRQKRLRKTKAELVAELEALERRPAAGGGAGDAYFRAVIRNSPTAIFVRDLNSRYLLVNETYETLYKVDDEDLFGKTPFDVFKRDSAEHIVARDREILKSGRKVEYESDVTLIDGTTRVQSVISFPLHDSQGSAIGVCGILTDLAQQKRAEQAVRASEERLRAAIDSLREGFVLFDADDRLVAFNDRYLQLRPASQRILARGGTFEDMVREHVRLGMIPEAVGREEAFVRERMEQHRNFKGPIVRRFVDGRWYLIDEARTPEGGTALSVVDITDLKRTENALRKSEALFRAVVNHSPTKIHIKDVEGCYTLINKEAEKLFGVTDEDGRGKTSYDLFPKDVADAFMAHDRAVIQSGKVMEKEEEFTLEDGVHTFLTVKFPIYDLEGMAAVGAIGTDITERKRAEETVRRLAAAIEGLSENFALYGPDDRLIMCNRNYRELNKEIADATKPGTTFEQHVRAMVRRGLAPQAIGREEAWVRERLERHRNPGGPIEVARQDGRWLLVREQRMADGSTATIATDITERKKSEAALAESEQLLRGAIESMQEGFVLYDADDRVVMVNDVFRQINPRADEILEKRMRFEDFLRANVARGWIVEAIGREEEFIRERLAQHRDPKGPIIRQFRDGKWYILKETRTPTGGAAITFTDITEIKKMETAVRDTEAKLRAVFDNTPACLNLKDTEGRYLIINKPYVEWLGHPAEEIIGKTASEFMDDAARVNILNKAEREVLETGKVVEREVCLRGPDGKTHDRIVIKFPVRSAEGKISAIGTVAIDITERKRAEAALAESEQRFKAFAEAASDWFWDMDENLRFTCFSERRQALMDLAPEENVGKTRWQAAGADPDKDPKWRDHRATLEARESFRDFQYDFTDARGRRFFISVSGTPVFDRAGAFTGYRGTATNITERKAAEKALHEAQERFRIVVDNLPMGINLKDKDGRFVLINKKFEEWYGKSEKEILGKLTEEIIDEPTSVIDARVKHQQAVLEKGKAVTRQTVKKRVDGTVRAAEITKFPIVDADGRVNLIGTVSFDITERKWAEEALRESEARLSNILENSPTPIYFKDPQGRFLIANKQYEKMYRVKFNDIRGKTSKQIFGGSLGEQFYEHDQMVLKSRKVIEREEHIFGRSYLTLKFPIVDQTGELLGLGGIETDVTEIKRAEKNLRGAKEQAEFASRAKTEFLANMSHELRTPLNSILGLSEILMNETMGPLGSPRYREYADDIHTSGKHLLSLISEVLDLSKIEAGELEIIESEIDVTDAVSTCVRMIEGRSPKEAPRVSVEFANGLPRLLGDERRFKQILLNLLGNAVKFTPHDGEVSVAARVCDGDRFTIEVADTGIGIAAEDIPKVLEPFGQVRDVFTRKHEGTGLGLYLAKSFTEMHGGTLDIASALGKGTTVTLRFPKERTVARH